MARIEGIPADKAPLFVRIAYWFSRRIVGKVPEPLTISAKSPAVFRATVGFEYYLAKAKRVDARLLSLAGLKTAMRIGCPF